MSGRTEKSADGRTAVILTDSERNLVLEEMRALLNAVHEIHKGLSVNDREGAAKASEAVGMHAVNQLAEKEASILLKLPVPMKTLGVSTHQEFDRFADLLRNPESSKEDLLKGLAELTERCIICHNQYKIVSE